jgi:hypothetical protein
VTNERRGFHAADLSAILGLIICIQTINGGSGLSNTPAAQRGILLPYRSPSCGTVKFLS